MEAKINIFRRKANHWELLEEQRYDIREELLKGDTHQEILDKFYKKDKRSDASFYIKFVDPKWRRRLEEWYDSEDYAKRSFSLYYENSIVD